MKISNLQNRVRKFMQKGFMISTPERNS